MRYGILGGALLWVLIAWSCGAFGHSGLFTAEENEWLNRQRSVDGMKCCDERDVHVGQAVEWRIVGGRYQVKIMDAWRDVPPGRVLQHREGDASPFGGEALLFWSPAPHTAEGFRLWCFAPAPLT